VKLTTSSFIPALGPTQLCIQLVSREVSLWVRRPGREADHSFVHTGSGAHPALYTLGIERGIRVCKAAGS
jgi:hypothetical protein